MKRFAIAAGLALALAGLSTAVWADHSPRGWADHFFEDLQRNGG